jgi:spermidine synthase
MKPSHTLAETTTPDGARLTLVEHDGSYSIRLNGFDLMSSRAAASELRLGELGCARLWETPTPRVLIGGLGLGFTLKSVLEQVGPGAVVEVAELFPEVIAWNREFLSSLNGALLEDPRVTVHAEDVFHTLKRGGREAFDAILLDIDNGPSPMVQKANARLYNPNGLDKLALSVKPGGRVAIWSAARDAAFEKRLKRAGLTVEAVPTKRYATAKRDACTIYLADPFQW